MSPPLYCTHTVSLLLMIVSDETINLLNRLEEISREKTLAAIHLRDMATDQSIRPIDITLWNKMVDAAMLQTDWHHVSLTFRMKNTCFLIEKKYCILNVYDLFDMMLYNIKVIRINELKPNSFVKLINYVKSNVSNAYLSTMSCNNYINPKGQGHKNTPLLFSCISLDAGKHRKSWRNMKIVGGWGSAKITNICT